MSLHIAVKFCPECTLRVLLKLNAVAEAPEAEGISLRAEASEAEAEA